MSIAALSGADKDKPSFDPGRAASYLTRQTISQVTIAAVPYQSDEQNRLAFGKANPNAHGVLPVLLIIENDSPQAVSLESMKVEFVAPSRSHVEAIPANEVRYLTGPRKPSVTNGPLPTGGAKIGRRKNPLDTWEIEGRAFSARMLPPGQQASGFFYFETGMRTGSQVYISGIRQAASGKELFYFEIPLE